ncbi:HK97 gp10 family phage protein [Cohnella xylanilytica]|uniref:HK97 gp10 family phage protein n=1 Tax=Cohnella xylanilytica TaxID=557555 RepID=A0A841TQB1_9BACL|nr:HK97-gp10 family putative phage morphogenesis protein [Cohnella xylanilytica]MBB6689909.1 HK97 gp10 family phage protein [Cohnella xylanilytica]
MADRKLFRFGIEGIEAMTAALDKIGDDLDRGLDEVLLKLALKIAQDAKRLAPVDSGDLEAAINVDEVKKLIGMSYIDIGTSPEVDHYAVVQHEGFRKTANGSIVELRPGEKTLSKGAYNGYMPGKKFLENALMMNEKLITEELKKVLGVG